MNWFEESLYIGNLPRGYAQRLEIAELVWQEKTPFQDLLIFDSPWFGRVLALDGVVQTTEADEFAYHEMLSHVPLFAHGSARRVLIVGGGDGGVLREVLRHPIDQATVVDIDGDVVARCRELMPTLSRGAFEDPRCELIIADGVRFVAESSSRYDVVIVDSPDPIGPAEALFSQSFYADCKQRLTSGGIIVTQNGSPFLNPTEVIETQQRLRPHFADVTAYLVAVPSYVCAPLTLAWGCDDAGRRQIALASLERRFAEAGIATRYYAPDVHLAAFALPPYIRKLVD